VRILWLEAYGVALSGQGVLIVLLIKVEIQFCLIL